MKKLLTSSAIALISIGLLTPHASAQNLSGTANCGASRIYTKHTGPANVAVVHKVATGRFTITTPSPTFTQGWQITGSQYFGFESSATISGIAGCY
jgi:hypothetical protein